MLRNGDHGWGVVGGRVHLGKRSQIGDADDGVLPRRTEQKR
jgi:hypothetical protein